MEIREAGTKDLNRIMEIVDAARGIMRKNGNMLQWTGGYPSEEVILKDIAEGWGHVCTEDGETKGYFAMIPSPEPTYKIIYDGAWLDDTLPYFVIHRISSLPEFHGVMASILGYAEAQCRKKKWVPNIRIDTHRDNLIMQHILLKEGFRYCGIIYLASGDERLAYQRLG
jgi:hypothetical protein